ncbi:MAG: ABC transporter ATP-binding protein [Kiritimatiellae bacterium]|nr:ABC transporter ATP-binding protein [Kiritimatiellia bacterium]
MGDIVIEIDNVSKTFRDFWLKPVVKAVQTLSLEVKRGEVFGLLGPNGSGKSTTIRMLLGLTRPDAGQIRVFGKSPSTSLVRAKIGYLPEQSYLHPFLTARETILYYAGLSNLDRKTAIKRTDELLEMIGLSKVANRRVGDFSKGMSRRVSLASSLVGKPELLILDEPTSGLDPVSTKEVKTLVKALAEGGMTVLTTSHLLADSEDICDRVAILDSGCKIAEGKIGELGQSLEEFFLAKVGNVAEFTLADFLK